MKKASGRSARTNKLFGSVYLSSWRRATLAILLLTSLVKLWLVAGQHLDIISVGLSTYDQGMFFTLANSILHGHWLGSYNYLILVKGPFYPLYIALVSLLHVPLLFSEQLLYILACGAFLLCIQPLINGRTASNGKAWLSERAQSLVTIAVGVLVIVNPMTSDINSGASVMRDGIYPALTLLTIALFIGLVSYRAARLWKYLLLSIGAGLCLSAFWLTREEGSVLKPFMIGSALYLIMLLVWQRKTLPRWKWRLGGVAIPFFMLWLAVFTVSAINYHYYGVNTTVEFKTPQFLSAYSSLTRVNDGAWLPLVPVSTQQRQLIYKVSPAFTELKPYLEGNLGQAWASRSASAWPYKGQVAKGEMSGGSFVFALRGAMADAGYYSSGPKTLSYYTRLANQVNGACDQGKLTCFKSTDNLYPPLNKHYVRPFITTFYNAFSFMTGFKNYDPTPVNDIGDAASVNLIAKVTHQSATNRYGHKRVAVLKGIGRIYQVIFPVFTYLALASYAFLLCFKRSYKDPLLIMTGLVGVTVLARMVLLTGTTVTSFAAINTLYFSSSYPLLILFDALSLVLLYKWYALRPVKHTAARKPA